MTLSYEEIKLLVGLLYKQQNEIIEQSTEIFRLKATIERLEQEHNPQWTHNTHGDP